MIELGVDQYLSILEYPIYTDHSNPTNHINHTNHTNHSNIKVVEATPIYVQTLEDIKEHKTEARTDITSMIRRQVRNDRAAKQ